MSEYSQLDNDSLRLVLLKNGIEAGPVNELTRKVYLNKLARLAKDSPKPQEFANGVNSENAPPEPVHMKTRSTQSIGEFLDQTGPDCSSTPAVGFKNAPPSKPQAAQRKGIESNQTGTGSPRKQLKQQNEVPVAPVAISRQAEPQSAPRRANANAVSESLNATYTKPESLVHPTAQAQATAPVSSPSVTLFSRDLECDSAKRSHLTEIERDALRHRLSQAIKPRKPIEKLNSSDMADSLSIEHSRTFTIASNSNRLESATRHVDSGRRHLRAASLCGLTKFRLVILMVLVIISCAVGYLAIASSYSSTYQLDQ